MNLRRMAQMHDGRGKSEESGKTQPSVTRYQTYALECYCPNANDDEIAATLVRLRRTDRSSEPRLSQPSRCLVFPDDKALFFLIAANDAEDAVRAAAQAGIKPARVARCHIAEE